MLGRYQQLLDLINIHKPQSIVEIGTWSGDNAVRMIKQASKHHKKIEYIGYDLFEEADRHTDASELNVKRHFSRDEVSGKISSSCPSAEINLIKGNTRKTLTNIVADFVFIDGGHSVSTIASDYAACQGSRIIVLDDFYCPDENDEWPDIDFYGCNRLCAELESKCEFLPIADRVRNGGLVQMILINNEKEEK